MCKVREKCSKDLVQIFWTNWRQLPPEIAETMVVTGISDSYHDLLVGPCNAKQAADASDCSLVRAIDVRSDYEFDCTYDEWVACLRDEVRQAACERTKAAALPTEVMVESVDLSTWLHEAQTTGLKDGTSVEARGDGWVLVARCGTFLLDPREPSWTFGEHRRDLPATIFPTVEAAYAAWLVLQAAVAARWKRREEALRLLGRDTP